MANVQIWKQYYTAFNLDPDAIRPGCEPRLLLQNQPSSNAIVLVHGLTDSPYYMEAIGKYFHDVMGFDVYIPLLDKPGLKYPKGMEGVSKEAWNSNVDYALAQAHKRRSDTTVSIGGLSTGGTLSVHCAHFGKDLTDVTGAVFLFSAALGLGRGAKGILQEVLLSVAPLVEIADIIKDKKKLIGECPSRYDHMDYEAASQLVALIREIREDIIGIGLHQSVFAAYSEVDTTADPEDLLKFLNCCPSSKTQCFPITAQHKVAHASVVLEEDILVADEEKCEKKNPCFTKMMQSAHTFAKKHLTDVL